MRKIIAAIAALAIVAGAFLMGTMHGRELRMTELQPWINRIGESVEIDYGGRTWEYEMDFRDGLTKEEWLRGEYTTHGLVQH